jgi:hypothetical protein
MGHELPVDTASPQTGQTLLGTNTRRLALHPVISRLFSKSTARISPHDWPKNALLSPAKATTNVRGTLQRGPIATKEETQLSLAGPDWAEISIASH